MRFSFPLHVISTIRRGELHFVTGKIKKIFYPYFWYGNKPPNDITSIGAIGSQGMIPLASLLAGVVLGSLGSTPLLAFCSLGFMATALFLLGNRSIREF